MSKNFKKRPRVKVIEFSFKIASVPQRAWSQAGHSISVNEDHPAQGLAVDPLYFRISILPRWQIPDQHESRTRPLRFTQNLTHVFLWICALICIFFIESCSYWNKIWRNESILTKIGLFYLFGINFSSWILKNNAQLKQKCSLHSHFF